jgi:ferredoxin-NADP reductase
MELTEGDEIDSDGPGGKFILREGAPSHVMIAGGIGITPFRSMLAQLAHDSSPANATLLYANRDDIFIYDDELADYASKDKTLKIQKFVDKRINQDDLKPFVEQTGTVFYLSGPKAMVESYETMLPDMGVSPDNVMKDYFPGY